MGNWIFARLKSTGKVVRVCQDKAGDMCFHTDEGERHNIYELDFTNTDAFPQDALDAFLESNNDYAKQQMEHQEMLNKMLSSMDANAIADHKAEIDEREYWRRLRGDIALEMLRCGHMKGVGVCADYGALAQKVKVYFDELYNQDREFFKDREKDGKDSY